MKNKLIYLIIFILTCPVLRAQSKQFEFHKGNCIFFSGSIYSYGIRLQNKTPTFCIYKMDLKLKVLDSMIIDAGKNNPGEYLQTYSDTLHDYLNIYFQKKEKKAVTILRLNKKFELIATIDNVDIARLNNTALFSSEVYYFKNSVYSLKTVSDTSGKQFYLNKHFLKSETANFDYEFKWQFPFERKNIHSAHIFFANKNYVLLFVTVNSGIKSGQWVLKINPESGNLEKATKLNAAGETGSYQYGTSFIDKNYKSISLAGQKFTEAQFDPDELKLNIANAPFSTVYYIEIDSLGESVSRQDFKFPVNDIKTGVKKTASGYILRLYNLTKGADGSVSVMSDIYKSGASNLCYLYSNSTVLNFSPADDKLNPEKTIISPNLLVEQFYASNDKLDMNGKLCIDSLNQFEKLFYKPLTFPVKQQFRVDEEKNPLWVLSKHTTQKNAVNFSFLGPVKKIYQVKTIEEVSETTNPVFTNLKSGSYIISYQIEEGKYILKLYN